MAKKEEKSVAVKAPVALKTFEYKETAKSKKLAFLAGEQVKGLKDEVVKRFIDKGLIKMVLVEAEVEAEDKTEE